MPSSPGPTNYQRTLQRFIYRGISLMPQDALPPGKFSWAQNIRSYEEGTIEVRYGLDPQLDAALAAPIHSIFRLDDPTPFTSQPSVRFLGNGADLDGQIIGTLTANNISTNYSGDPLTAVRANPFRSPRPFLYVADADQLRKYDSDFNAYTWGLPTPTDPPTAELAAIELTKLSTIGTDNWIGYGANASPGGNLVPLNRINTTLTSILYDDGASNTGMASAAVVDFANFTPGALIDVNGEEVVVQSIHPPCGPTTIGAILYDSGVSGPCSIQPTEGFSVGQIEMARKDEWDGRVHIGLDAVPRVTVTRTVDFPVDSLILLGGVEVVRITSVAMGPDGLLSFRCSTVGTFAAGATITGLPSFRAYFAVTHGSGDPVTELAVEINVTPASVGAVEVIGFQQAITPVNWALVGTRATSPDDIIRLGFKASLLGFVEFVRLMIDVSDPAATPFEQDYYVYEWRAADLISAIQATGSAATTAFVDGQSTAVERGQTQSIYSDQYGQGQVSSSDPVVGLTPFGVQIRRPSGSVLSPFGMTPARTPGEWERSTSAPGQSIYRRIRSAVERAKSAPVVAGASISRQLALGNDVWMTLECRVGDLTRIGTRTDLNLTAVRAAAVYAQTTGTVTPMVFQLSDPYLVGGYGPDIGLTLPPYVYRYSYRSTLTGERSNTSPPMRAGFRPQRGRVELRATVCAETQCDAIDFWRFGGALSQWSYVGTTLNDPNSPPFGYFADDMADSQIDGGPTPRVDLFQPWPILDLPRTGTCNIAGTSVEWVSGDVFNVDWSADTIVIINGRASSLYGQPASTTRLEVVDNLGEGLVNFEIPQPLIVSQPLARVWGGLLANTLFHFACGDANDPGVLHWTNANDPDSASDANQIAVTSAAEPLLNGYMDDGNAYVFSTERLFRVVPTPGDPTPFRVVETACTKGLWAPWAFAVDPDGGCYFLAKDGWYMTSGGSEAKPVSSPDLQPLFPHDGSEGEAIRNLSPVDMTLPARLRAAFVGWNLYFDYVDQTGTARTLLYEPKYDRWTPDTYFEDASVSPSTTAGATVRLSEPGESVLDHLIACEDSILYNYTIAKTADDLADINWAIWTPWANGDDPRQYKQWGDAILDFNPGGSTSGILVTPVVDNGNVALAPQTLGAGDTLRATYTVELGADVVSPELGYGILSRNCGLLIEGAVQSCDIQRPIFFLWEPAFLFKGTSTGYRATDWEDLGYKGAKFVQGIVLRANTFGVQKDIEVQFDGPNGAPQIAMTLSVLHDGEQSIAYPNIDTGWQPFHAELVRLRATDADDWILFDWRWVFEPAPEAATQWETQDTTFDLPGFLSVHDGVMAYAAPAPVELVVTHDQSPVTYNLPATVGGDYQRVYVRFEAAKGKSASFQWSSESPFRLYKRDCSVRIQGWGLPGGFAVVSPFGGDSRIDGAGI